MTENETKCKVFVNQFELKYGNKHNNGNNSTHSKEVMNLSFIRLELECLSKATRK